MTDLEKIMEAKDLYIPSARFFRQMITYYKIQSSLFLRFLRFISGILWWALPLCFLLHTSLPELEMFNIYSLYAGIAMFFLHKWIKSYDTKLCDVFQRYKNSTAALNDMVTYMDSLSFAFWKKRYINKICSMLQNYEAASIQDAAAKIKPKWSKRKRTLNADRFNKFLKKDTAKYNECLRKKYEEENAAAQKQMIRQAMRNAVVQTAFESLTNVDISSVSAPPDIDYGTSGPSCSDQSDQAYRQEIEAKKSEYLRLADQAEQKYYSLKRSDPQCLDERTKVAEYNMNYFRRKASELG